MDPTALLGELARRGLSIRAEDAQLIVSPATQLPAELHAAIAAQKTALLALVASAVLCPDCNGHCVVTLVDPQHAGYAPGRLFWCADRRCGRIVWRPEGESSAAEAG
jgi:hypothetical protein